MTERPLGFRLVVEYSWPVSYYLEDHGYYNPLSCIAFPIQGSRELILVIKHQFQSISLAQFVKPFLIETIPYGSTCLNLNKEDSLVFLNANDINEGRFLGSTNGCSIVEKLFERFTACLFMTDLFAGKKRSHFFCFL